MSSPSTRNEAEALFFDWQGGSQFGFRSGGGFGFLTHGACLPDQARDSRDYSARSFCVAGNSLYGPLRIGTPHPAPCAPFDWNAGRNDFPSAQAKGRRVPGAVRTSSAIDSRIGSEG